jgi:hypothetical protein
MTTSLEQSRAHAAAHRCGPGTEEVLRRSRRSLPVAATTGMWPRRTCWPGTPRTCWGRRCPTSTSPASAPVGTANVLVDNPSVESQGWSCGHTVIQIVTDDMPFLVDSVTMALTRRGLGRAPARPPPAGRPPRRRGHLVEVLDVRQGPDGEFGVGVESWMHIEIDRVSDAADRERIAAELREPCSTTCVTPSRTGPRCASTAESRRRAARAAPGASMPPRSPRGALPELAGRQPLHLPRLPSIHLGDEAG